VPIGAACIQIACTDGGVVDASVPDAIILIDGGACVALPAQDPTCSGATPHFYSCFLASLPAPCVRKTVGDATDTYCCP
jgi:hypothetical protein